MDVRSPLYQNIALIVAGVLFLNPIVATAAQLAVDQAAAGNTAVTQAQNGVPMVNIATPNGSGLSHNKFTDYNVGQQGLILNNSAQNVVQTQLGGYVVGNPNLKNGAAGLILNEVTGGNASQLRGYTEVAGRSAAVIVANPHGITCDGCGFINTPRVTLSTGTPVVEDGRLQRFDVDGGQISIEGAGLNAGNVDQFDLITRSAQINAELHAKKLNIITGRNDVDATTLAATAKADDGSDKPMLAIDSSALGGMYAGAIRLVGTEQGVGVKLAGDMAASAGDIQIDANGKLSLARVATSNDLKLAAEEIELGSDTYAGRNAVVSATGKTQVKDSLAAGNRVEIGGGELDNQGVVEAGVKADGTLVSDSTLVLNSRSVTNRGELIARGSFEADVEVLDNSSGKLLSAGNANIQAAQLSNSQGRVIAQRNLELGGGALSNQDGEVLAAGELHVDAASLDNQSGTVAANAIDLKLSGVLSNAQGLIESSQALELAVDSVQNRDGRLRALASSDKSAFQVGNLFNNDQGLVEIGNAAFALASGSLSNQGGTMRHLGSQGFELNLADLGNAGGRFSTNGELSLSADDWNNTSELQAERLTLNIGQFTQTATGQLISRQSITANGDNWVNDGVIATDGSLDLTLTGRYEGNGALRSLGDLTFKAASAEFGSDAEAKSGGAARFELSGQLLSRGRLTAAQDMSLALGSLDNRGTLGGAGLLRIEADSLRNEQGLVFSGADMTLRAGSLTNYKGDIYSLGALSVAKDDSVGQLATLENISGTIESAGSMQLAAASLINRKDVFAATASQLSGHMTLTGTDNCKGQHCEASYVVTEVFGLQVTQDSARANLIAGGDLNFIGGSFDNRFSTVSSGGDIKLDTLNFRSTGAAGGETRYYDYYVYTKSRPDYYGLLTNIDSYNAYHDPSSASYNPAAMPLSSFAIGSIRHSNIVKTSGGGETVNSVIQAVGKVDITGSQALENSLVRPGEQIDQSPSRVGQTTVSSDVRPAATLNAQLPPDLQQQAVDPLAQPSFTLPQGQNGLFRVTTTPGNRYLVETDPAFADLRNFLNSDYLLSRLGFDPDQVQKRLGDGLYEQRLIRDAVVARTGQRLIAGLDSDEAMYRYLMDNAVASKEALNLVPGVALTAEQVAALTHDIVWMQEQEVHGEKVLVPVLYLAQASGRLAPTGALIQGSEVSLISGGDLANKGTLRASGDFNAVAKNIGNQGLIQAGNRLALLATDSIRNAQGGIINGRDVSLTAISGDITNERSIGYTEQSGRFTFSHASVDSAARIEASNNLVMDAGRDLNNLGSVLKAGGDATLSAKRDLTLGVVTEVDSYNSQYRKLKVNGSQTTQHGSDVQVGGGCP
ncbi:filamentous hemagglutinin N-terminal domain-containing protein [Ectopseudomonas khazarica]|uniref:Filamentous hemagglutinin N-terminal domain-containing protein n=1 Tax=Ectopseudomonas khazarica TaxID=2502979 RepID=A0ABW7MDG0_9GAMM